MEDAAKADDFLDALMNAGSAQADGMIVSGELTFTFTDKDGNIFRQETVHNLITTVGKNLLWDSTLSGSAYTTTGPYMGLISSASFSAVSAADTMASHAGWLEANGTNAPSYGATRPTVTYSASSAGVKSSSSTQTFVFTNSGTIQGAFQVTGPAATNSTTGTVGSLFSEGTITAQPVINTNTLTVSWSGTLT